MAWRDGERPGAERGLRTLVVGGRAVAALEIAGTRRERGRGLLGRDHLDGALLLPGVRSVHTFGMRFAIDVSQLDADLRIVAVRTVPPGRLVLPRRGVAHTVEAEAGAFTRWGARAGTQVGIDAPATIGPKDDAGELRPRGAWRRSRRGARPAPPDAPA